MNVYTTERAEFAANTLVGVEITFGTLSFWSKAFERGHYIDFAVAALLTAAFGSVSLLASGVVTRAVSAHEADEAVTRGLVAFCGLVVALISGGMTWHGLVWADAQADLIPGTDWDWLFIPAAMMLSGLNLVALYTFAREIKAKKPAPRSGSLDNQLWNIQPTGPHSVIRFDANTKARMEEIKKAVNAAAN